MDFTVISAKLTEQEKSMLTEAEQSLKTAANLIWKLRKNVTARKEAYKTCEELTKAAQAESIICDMDDHLSAVWSAATDILERGFAYPVDDYIDEEHEELFGEGVNQ